jgi:capsular polysaccharide transport system permease protein
MNSITLGLSRQMRIVSALTIREVRLRNSKHAFSQLFDLLEAVVFIVAHFIIFTFLGRHLLIGDSLLLFITTGILPVLFFRSISIRTSSALESAKAVTSIPFIEAIDYAIARGFVEFLSFTLAFIGFVALCHALQPGGPRSIYYSYFVFCFWDRFDQFVSDLPVSFVEIYLGHVFARSNFL